MSKICDIQNDGYQVGDGIRIQCALGLKEGVIVEFCDDRLRLQPLETGKKIMSISESSIVGDWEEIDIQQSIQEEIEVPTQKNVQVGTFQKQNEDIEINNNDQVQLEENNVSKVQPVVNVGIEEDLSPVVTKKELDRELLKKIKKEAKKEQTNNSTRDFGQLASMLGVENEIAKLAENDPKKLIRENGRISSIGMDYGFIEDNKSRKRIWFSCSELIRHTKNVNYTIGDYVVYTKSQNFKGDIAISIHKPMTVGELLTVVDYLVAAGKKMDANEVLNHIFSSIPNCTVAIEKQKEINRKNIYATYQKQQASHSLSSNIYDKAKSYQNNKEYQKAIQEYLKAIECGQKTESAIKDLGMLYISLSKKDDSHSAEYYYGEAKKLITKYGYKLQSETNANLSYLENFYYAIRDFEQFKITAQKLLEILDERYDGPRYVFLLNKLAAVYIKEGKIDHAKKCLSQVLDIYPNSTGASKLLDIIESAAVKNIEDIITLAEIESFNTGLSPFINKTLDNYEEYAGAKTKDIESRAFTTSTLKDVREVISKAGAARAKERANYLLTEGKLMRKLEPSDEMKLRSVMARYCNAMALNHISENNSLDVIRFFYNESFSLEGAWDSNVRQVALCLLTHIHDYKQLIQDSGKNNSIDSTLGLVFETNHGQGDSKVWESILSMMLYNREISAQLLSRLFQNEEWRKRSITALKNFGIRNLGIEINKEDFTNAWNEARDNRIREYKRITNTINSYSLANNLEEFINQTSNISEIVQDWMCPLDKNRVRDIKNTILPAIDAYIKSSGYRNKEANKNNAIVQINQLCTEIEYCPTQLSFEAMLILLNKLRRCLENSFEEVKRMSEPRINMRMLSNETVYNDNIVSVQISVSTHKDSSPIKDVFVEIVENEDIHMIEGVEKSYNAIEGGETQIFKFQIGVSNRIVSQKATALNAICHYKTNDKSLEITDQLTLRLYSPEEFSEIDNPYAPLADGGPVPIDSNMFYGREEFIGNIVNAITNSPSKQIIIYGQKRSGKSSVMLHLKQKLINTGRNFCVFFSIGDIIQNLSEATFYHKIIKTISDELDFLEFDGTIGAIPKFDVPSITDFIAEDPINPLNTFTKYMVKFKMLCNKTEGWNDKNLVVMIDEFTYLYTEIKRGSLSPSLMKQWKAITQNERAQFSVVLVGQDVVPSWKKEDYASNAFGVIQDIRLTYLQEIPARNLIEKPILGPNGESRYVGNAVSKIIEYTSSNPYYIQIFCARLVEYMNRNKSINVTEADVEDVAMSFIKGSEALVEDKFDNLIRAGETEDLQEFPEKQILNILKQIAVNSKTTGYCNRDDIQNLDEQLVQDILKHLTDREVIECKGDGNYKIQVKLFQEWLINH